MIREKYLQECANSYLAKTYESLDSCDIEFINCIIDAFEAGAKWADANPKSPWISVEDDLPCNHKEMVVSSGIEEKDTLIVLVRFAVGFVDFAYMYYFNNEWRWNTYFKVSHWMLVPEFRED